MVKLLSTMHLIRTLSNDNKNIKGPLMMYRAPIICSILLVLGCQPNTEKPNENAIKAKQVNQTLPIPPVALKKAHEMKMHGDTRVDQYYWMRDDQRKDPKVLAHLESENEYAKQVLAHTEDLQEKILKELNNRMEKDDSTVPIQVRGYYYYRRFEGDKEYPIYVRKKQLDSPEEILLDGNLMAEGHDYFSIGSSSVSTNNQLHAYSTDTLSRRVYTIKFKDLTTGKPLFDKLEETTGQVVWANDNKTVFYIRKNLQTLLGDRVYRHELGTAQSEDVLVYEESNKSFYTGLGKTKDDSYIAIYHSSTISSGASLLNANKPTQAFQLFHPLEENHEYQFEKLGDDFYILTNWQAKNFRLMKTSLQHASNKMKWQEVIPHRDSVYLNDFELFDKFLVLRENELGETRIVFQDWGNGEKKTVEFEDPVFVAGFSGNVNNNTNELRLFYSSMTTPMSYYDFNMQTGERKLLKQDKVLGDYDRKHYASERFFAAASDGKKIPVTIVYRKDKFKKDGTNPIYQYGYGSYGSTIDPFFSGSRISLLDRGFVYAIAHIRGSQMLGRPWYDDGKMFNKKNTFTDFIDVTKALIENKYGAPSKVFAAGGSAGGLLVGAVINLAPELYRGVAAHVPFVDVVTTMLDESIPLTTNEYDEWGNPNNKDSYEYMLSYSPYDNVIKQNYPNILVTTGLHDSQVQYFEPAKWVAKLREYKTDNNRLIYKTNMEAGHGGASGRFRRNKDRALEYAFFLDLAGIKE